jgi:hypothetical protein
MANQRKAGKKKLQIWTTDAERAGLQHLATAHGYDSVTAFVQDVANGTLKVSAVKKKKD